MKTIEVHNLVKKFGDLTAVDGVSFDVEEGEIFGFLGPNGAGKTTTINMLCTLLKITSGSATINGYDVASQPGQVRQSIGLIFQEPSLDDRLTGRENLRFHAMMYDLSQQEFRQRAEDVLQMVNLQDRADDQVREYSGGMRRRLEIARGLLHRPKVLFLDEPTLGLDPQTRRHIWDYIRDLRQREELTIFLTTHNMEEAEICDRIAIIDFGEIVALDTVDGLKSRVGGDVITMRTGDNQRAMQIIKNEHDLEPHARPDRYFTIETQNGENVIPDLLLTLSQRDEPIQVESINLRRPTLEDVFINITGRAIREEESDIEKEHLRRRMQLRRGNRE